MHDAEFAGARRSPSITGMNGKTMSDGRDRLYAEPLSDVEAFVFDEKVAAVFPDMIRRSVPGYGSVIALTGIIADEMAIGMVNRKTTAVRLIPVPGKQAGDRVVFGATVTVIEIDTDKELSYQIVGPDESDVEKNRISITSPIARALMGKEPGDEVTVRTPGGQRALEVVEVVFR